MTTQAPADWVPDAPEVADPGDDLDWTALEDRLRAELPALRGDLSVERFVRGGDHDAYRVRFGPTLLVVRAVPVDPEAHAALADVAAAYPRAPRPLLLSTDPAFQVLQYKPGFVIHDRLPNAFVREPDLGTLVTTAVVDALAELHAVDGGPVHGSFGLHRCQFNADPEEGDAGVVTGVLGWDAVRRSGDPREDLKSLVATWPGAALGLPEAAEVVARYAERTGTSLGLADLS